MTKWTSSDERDENEINKHPKIINESSIAIMSFIHDPDVMVLISDHVELGMHI